MRSKLIFIILCAALSILPQTSIFAAASKSAEVPDIKRLKAILPEFETYARKSMAEWKVPGMAIAIVKGKDVIYEKAFGVKTLGSKDPVTTDTVFQIGSTSKAFTALLVGMLVDEGKIGWDDPVMNHLSGFVMYDPWVTRQFTVTDLMAQRSGMPEHAGDTVATLGFDRSHVIDMIRFVKPVTSFRSAYAYQNGLFLVAAELVRKETGKSWEDNVKERIFEPLGMKSSSTDMSSLKNGKNVASLHHLAGDKIVMLPMDWKYMDWVYTDAPAGGINSNVKDIAKWISLQMNGGSFGSKQLIKADSIKYMQTPKTIIPSENGSPRQYYCQGWVYREYNPYPIIWHNGGTSGAKTMIAFVPKAKIGIVVLSNLDETSLPESLASRFFDMYFGARKRDWSKEELKRASKSLEDERAALPKPPAKETPALPAERYTGSYSNDIYGTVAVSQKDGALIVTAGPKKTHMALSHFDRDTFTASWNVYIAPEYAGLVRFDIGPDGFAESLTVQAFDADGCGVFRKIAGK
ncbi:MAG: serine hydrolase [Candidatus Omnitrophica bacterium]|nr:serine hydrolase [Candidatus Omnitrophota bacterium]